MIRAKFNPNVRTFNNGTCISFDDVDNDLLVQPGETMELYCPELKITRNAVVDIVNYNSQIIILSFG